MSQPVASRSSFRIVIVEDHVLFAESLELALTVEGYDVRRVTIPDKEQSPGALIAAITRRPPGRSCSTWTWAGSATASASSPRWPAPASTSWS